MLRFLVDEDMPGSLSQSLRVFGFSEMGQLDPFLLLNAFKSEKPDQVVLLPNVYS